MIIKKIKSFIKDNKLININDNLVVGFSGGPDSVFLLYFLNTIRKEYNLNLLAVHINHSIREEGAKKDEDFSRNFCKLYNIEFIAYKENVPKYAKDNKLSLEDAGRQIRYRIFNEEATKLGNNSKIAIAHHKDDVVETIFLNFLRGAGINGLIGIEEKNNNIIRPILNIEKNEILDFLNENKIEYVEDLSNYENDYRRNKVRNELIPYIKDSFNPGIVNSIINMSNIIREEYNFIDDYCNNLNLINKDLYNLYLNIDELLLQPIAIRRNLIIKTYEILNGSKKDLSFDNIETILDLLNKDSSSFIIKNYRIYTYNKKLFFTKIKDKNNFNFSKYNIGDNIYFNNYLISSEIINNSTNLVFDSNTSYFSMDISNDKLILRNRKDGDYIKLEGFKKKIKDIMIDNKIDKYERDNIPILVSNNEILWVLGIRRANLYKINKKMEKIIKISFERINNV